MIAQHPILKGQLICVALNDSRQLIQLEEQFSEPPHKQAPRQPVLYFKPVNTFNVHGATLPWLLGEDGQPATKCVIGASLAVVIGKRACRISSGEVGPFIAGVTLMHDFSLPESSYFRPDIRGKCQDGSAPVGPELVAAEHTENLQSLDITTSVNDVEQGRMPLHCLQRSIASLISDISWIMTLQSGDVIATGFPGSRITVQPGDRVASSIEGIGELVNTIGSVGVQS
ncbi:MAG: 5-oxopent-3-ene-1,2,5-tricarboxylate decarboxylase [Parasphingorhabdus sp.]|jgi:5-oxopent-3-ene-1,2,5-tricarboxylate decarboxylase/2-hydroxyhepta-2,4-diene-1,7-dioate isomerase